WWSTPESRSAGMPVLPIANCRNDCHNQKGPDSIGAFFPSGAGVFIVLHKLVAWMRSEATRNPGKGRFARWLGRNWAHFTYATRVEPTWLELNQLDIPIAGLPPAFAGFRIVQMSDFHGGRHVTPTYLNEAVDLAHAQEPDVIVLTGDFIHKGF